MSNYSSTIAAIIEQTEALEKTLPLKNEACRSKFFFHPQPTAKVCLFFHGFTAAPYQFEPISKILFEAGYNVLIPLLPGHGIAGKWNSKNPPPLPTEREVYQEFALSWLKVAQSLGNEIVVGGLSGGGTLAAWLALECSQEINKALLFSPYLSSYNTILDLFVEILPIYYDWDGKPDTDTIGYGGFKMPALRLFLDMGQEIVERVRYYPTAPMLVISSENDKAIDPEDLKAFFESLMKKQSKSWYYRFEKFFEIPHTMMTEAEGNKYQNLLNALVKAYVLSDISWEQLLEIGYHMLQGKTFDAAVKELSLSEVVVPEVSNFLAILDKEIMIKAHK
ncbi:MAG: alpha/beta fold hydrolase [Cyanomargarita calcarea GSE-NOS-MK-12-04C]|jgi:esterase/lipase|uniref:Alpha/beta fold hydrolase n=1 Tax=Cyanomargarita calcarea GSE-NOS-MK-12-04C TaxID=2839659 RepID=A0A951QWI5_9CYAN|nr:alpha/beta fold hydrolase [Cyanomargarita calcarea GSE-NOS-MK-12-04C]